MKRTSGGPRLVRAGGGSTKGDEAAGRRLVPLNAPTPIQLRTDATDTPVEVHLERRWIPVSDVHERWRIDDEWWRVPIRRIYHLLVLRDGRILTVYQDLEAGGWFEQS